jgi:glycosyltransferase involved in cell wall biosynthesis
VAYSCLPGHGSEPGVGWNRAIETARHLDTWVITRARENAGAIREHLRRHGPIPGLQFEFVEETAGQRALARVPGCYYLAYNLWQRRVHRVARSLHARIGFDIVHQVTFCGFREPGYLWKLGVPFVWGPVGGTQNYPWRLLLESGLVTLLQEGARNLLNVLQLRFSRRVRTAARRAAVVLAANSTNQAHFSRVLGIDATLLLETGLRTVTAPRHREPSSTLRILWSGRLAPHKALWLLLEALGRLPPGVAYELRVLGSGQCRRRLQHLAVRLAIDDRVNWMGTLPQAAALSQCEWADVLVFTSLRDTSGNVLLEALGMGVPVICLDHQGAGDIVTPQCGIKIPVTTRRDVITSLVQALELLARDPAERRRLSQGALERARDYLWQRNSEAMMSAYRTAMAGNPTSHQTAGSEPPSRLTGRS